MDDTRRMKLMSINTGLPRTMTWHGKEVTTGIFKQPVEGLVALKRLNLDGDRQADLSVHGGPHKAVYCYPFEHYDYWKDALPGHALPFGAFGENFTTTGLLEDAVHLGDRLSIGTAELVVTQPRLPCYKLGIKFQSDDMVRRFQQSGRPGFYLSVAVEGSVEAGDSIAVVSRDPNAVSIKEVLRLYLTKTYTMDDAALARRALQVDALSKSWREELTTRLQAGRE